MVTPCDTPSRIDLSAFAQDKANLHRRFTDTRLVRRLVPRFDGQANTPIDDKRLRDLGVHMASRRSALHLASSQSTLSLNRDRSGAIVRCTLKKDSLLFSIQGYCHV